MKVCPVCNQTYPDDNLNYCLNDGGTLTKWVDDAPPTVLLNQVRTTQQNWENVQQPLSPWENQPLQQSQPFQPLQQNQQFYQAAVQGQNQTLPTIALISGIFSIVLVCCYGGIPLGLAGIIIGVLGLKSTNDNPRQYGGRGLAIGGIVTGAIGLLISVVIILFAIIANVG